MTPPDQDLQELWQSQDVPQTEPDMEKLVSQTAGFQSTIKRRNALEYAAGAVVLVWFGSYALSDNPLLMRIGALLIGVGVAVSVTHIRLRGAAASERPPFDRTTMELISWHREELVRQRDLLLRVPRWYVGPLVPGLVVMMLGAFLAKPEAWPTFAVVATVVVLTLAIIVWQNGRGARKLEARIFELGSTPKQPRS